MEERDVRKTWKEYFKICIIWIQKSRLQSGRLTSKALQWKREFCEKEMSKGVMEVREKSKKIIRQHIRVRLRER